MKIKEFDNSFTIKKKGFFALGAVIFAGVWMILWDMFPMEWHAIFFSSTVGSYVHLFLLAAVLILPMCWVFTIITQSNISVTKNFIVNALFMIGIVFLYSAFRYSAVYTVIIAIALHIAAMTWVIKTAEPIEKKHIKRMKNEKYQKITGGTVESKDERKELSTKKQLIIATMWAVVYVVLINTANILLFWKIAYIFVG